MGIKWQHGIILDAGSSGTRIHVYRWLNNTIARQSSQPQELATLPVLETKDKWTLKIHPGVSTFAETPHQVGKEHLEKLYDYALDIIPKDQIAETPIFVLATAGVRLLPEKQREELLQQICSYTKSHTKFLLKDCGLNIQAISGETEGLYGWVAANYLVGGFDNPQDHVHGKGHSTYGFLDMGGASAQIAFAPNATEAEKHADDLKLLRLRTIDGSASEYKVFVTTWLGFGVNQARHRYVLELVEANRKNPVKEIQDPCLPAGVLMHTDGTLVKADEALDSDDKKASKSSSKTGSKTSTADLRLIGTGKFDQCLIKTFPLLNKDVPCENTPCLLDGVHVPAIDFDVNHFIGISEYWHSTHGIFEMGHKDAAYDFNTYQHRVAEFCSQDWSAIKEGITTQKWGNKINEQQAYEICFKASWIINVLHDGIGIPRVGLENTQTGHNGTKEVLEAGKEKGFLDAFQAVNKIKHTEVSWTLGKMVLYASSQVPPPEETALPVGFGSNEIGVPKDFQFPGGALLPLPDGKGKVGEWKDSLFDSDSPRRIPGLLMFLFIICIVVFFLCGRERRARLLAKISGNTGRRRGMKIPFISRSSHNYERVLEEGAAGLADASEFELGDMDDSSDDDRGKSKAWASPKSKRGRRGDSGSNLDLPGSGTMSPKILDRQGLALRTESSDRLASGIGGVKSRSGSPTRLKNT